MDDRQDEPWYSVRCLIRFPATQAAPQHYEERVTMWRSTSLDDAIARATAEAVGYAGDLGGEHVGLAQCFHLAVGGEVGDASEVFSLMRDSELDPAEYINRFFDTGTERQGHASD